MSDYTEKQLDNIFAQVRPISGLNQKEWGLDASNAIICRASYGREDEFFGWEVDHIVPRTLLESCKVPDELIDNEMNLRPLNWNNNVSKGDNYPKYDIRIVSEDEGQSNVRKKAVKIINKSKQEQLKQLYKDYLKL